ncbi:hypothetical protein ACLK19_13430 [Escherichia coli]
MNQQAVSNEHVGNDELCRKNATISGIAILTTTALLAPWVVSASKTGVSLLHGSRLPDSASACKHAGAHQ